MHLRTTNPIESTFATVRQRTRRTKNCDAAGRHEGIGAGIPRVLGRASAAQRVAGKQGGLHRLLRQRDGDQEVVRAVAAAGTGEAVGEDAALKGATKLTSHVGRHLLPVPVVFVG